MTGLSHHMYMNLCMKHACFMACMHLCASVFTKLYMCTADLIFFFLGLCVCVCVCVWLRVYLVHPSPSFSLPLSFSLSLPLPRSLPYVYIYLYYMHICINLRMNTCILYPLSGELVGTLFNLPPPSILCTLMRDRYSIGIVVSWIVDSEFQSCPSTPV